MAREGKNPEKTKQAVGRLIELILKSGIETSEDEFIQNEVLKTLIWKYTEAQERVGGAGVNAKYLSCPIWSAAAFESFKVHGKRYLELEHVTTRAELKERIKKSGSPEVLSHAVTCVVTESEHKFLEDKTKEDWERYERSGIKLTRMARPDREAMLKFVKGQSKDWPQPEFKGYPYEGVR